MIVNDPDALAELEAAFARYEEALVQNDVATLDSLFWPSSLAVRYGATENLYGYAEIAAFRAARPSNDLARTLRRTVLTTFGRNTGTTMTEFTRTSKPGHVGRQSQAWVKFADGWRIVAAHVSII